MASKQDTTFKSDGPAFRKLLRTTAREIGQPVDSLATRHVVLLKLCRRNIEIRLVKGERIDPADVVRLDDAMRSYLPSGEPPIKVEIAIVGQDGVPISELPRELEPEPTPPSPPTRPDPPTETKPSCPVPAVSNVVELPRRSGIHDDKEGLSFLKN